MELVELGLKNTVTGGTTQIGDDFSVDDFLDFSNGDVFPEDEAERKREVSVDGDNTLRRSNDFSTVAEGAPTSELSLPMDDLAELEWLSNFVDDSLTPYSAPTKKPVWLTGNRRHPVAPVKEESCPLPVKIRSRRARTGVIPWSLGSPDSSSSSTTSSSSSSSAPSSPLWLSGAEFLLVKRQKKMRPSSVVSSSSTQTQTRRCSHCGVQKTPQWRAGPQGAKTLCNACGVRFKSGRLLPEYRPACSPTFSTELHSNHHRKVIEMRRKKETTDVDQTGLNPSVQVLPSF